jgi:hypothetical protein
VPMMMAGRMNFDFARMFVHLPMMFVMDGFPGLG